MSRNKLILLILLLAIIYFIMPNDGIYGVIKLNFRNLLPYIMIGIIIYLVITINVLKRMEETGSKCKQRKCNKFRQNNEHYL